MKKIKYSILYKKEQKLWILWKDVESEKGMYCKSVFKGDKKSCINERKKLLKN